MNAEAKVTTIEVAGTYTTDGITVEPQIVQTKHKPGLAAFVREMTMAGQFGVDEHGVGIGPMPTNRAQARSAVGGRTRGCGARKRARIRQWKRQMGLS